MSEQQNPTQTETKTESPASNGGESSHCIRCKRPLKNPIYRKIGMGKICLSKSSVTNKAELLNQLAEMEQKRKEELRAKKLQEHVKDQKVTEQAFADNK